jgi:hypothetical protein
MIGVQSPTEAENFSSHFFVRTSTGAHSDSYKMDTEDSFSGGKGRPGRDSDNSAPSSAEVKGD